MLFILDQTLLRPIFFFFKVDGQDGLAQPVDHRPMIHLNAVFFSKQEVIWFPRVGFCFARIETRVRKERNHTDASPKWYQTAPQVMSSTFLYPDFFNSCCSYFDLSAEHLIRICVRVKTNLISFSHFTYLTETLLIITKPLF